MAGRLISMEHMEDVSDKALAEAAHQGDSEAFSTLLERHYGLIFRTAWKWCGMRTDAEDIAQNVCLKLATVIGQYRGDAAFTSWLYRITLNAAKDYTKSKGRRSAEQGEETLEQFASDLPDPEASLISRGLYHCIAALPEKLRMAVLLVCAEGLNHAEAGKALGCKEGTISWRLSEARKQLALCLEGK